MGERMSRLTRILVVGIMVCLMWTRSFAVEFRSATGYAVGSSPSRSSLMISTATANWTWQSSTRLE
jgi:hypothetical protein